MSNQRQCPEFKRLGYTVIYKTIIRSAYTGFYGGNVMFGHGFDKLVQAFLCGGDTKFKLPKAGNGNVFFLDTWVGFAREGKAVALQYHEQ